jgi:hypothetical protein
MNSEIDVSPLLASPSYDPWNCANSAANLGDNARQLTWEASKQAAKGFALTPEHQKAFRDFVKSSGGWTREEIDAWDEAELTALCVQWISGDIRDAFGDDLPDDPSEWDWEQYKEDCEAGRVSGNLYLHEGKVYWNFGV